MKKWNSVEEVHKHAKNAVGQKSRNLVSEETVDKYYASPNNKGWLGNAIESDWFQIPNNSRAEADIPYLNLEIKVTPIKETKKGWSAKERLTLNIFDFNDEYKRSFENASFLEKANLTELLYYQYLNNVDYPDMCIVNAHLFDIMKDISEEDLLIIKSDWEKIVDKIKEGKAEELSDKLTKYLAATTKGAKTEKNMTTQPFSDVKAHRRAFTFKPSYMTQFARRLMGDKTSEIIFKDINELKEKSFEEIIVDRFSPFIGKTKRELASQFDVTIKEKNDKSSSALLARKMLNISSDIQETDEFKKSGIAVKIVTYDSTKKHIYPKLKEGLKLQLPDGNYNVDPNEMLVVDWEESDVYNYLSTYKFLLVVFEKKNEETIFKGAKFWYVPDEDLITVGQIWTKAKQIFEKGVELSYKSSNLKKGYIIENNLPSESGKGTVFHIRPSSKKSCYIPNKKLAMRLPHKSTWINVPDDKINEFHDYYMTKQSWWFSPGYMYEQVKEFFE